MSCDVWRLTKPLASVADVSGNTCNVVLRSNIAAPNCEADWVCAADWRSYRNHFHYCLRAQHGGFVIRRVPSARQCSWVPARTGHPPTPFNLMFSDLLAPEIDPQACSAILFCDAHGHSLPLVLLRASRPCFRNRKCRRTGGNEESA
jgi:hypothetical protein